MKKLLALLFYFRRHARPLGAWYSVADRDGNVRIVPSAFR
jgi:hypothetical protein